MERDELFGQDHENQEGEGRPVPTDWDGVDAPKSDFTDSAEAQASEQFNAADEEATGSPRPEYRAQAKGAGKKSGGAGKLIAAALACALVGGAAAGAVTASLLGGKQTTAVTTTGSNAGVQTSGNVTEGAVQQLASELKTNVGDKAMTPADVYNAYADSVVAIANEGTTTNIFGQVSATASSGSGFILSEDGYIVTNYHVIEGAEKLTVKLHSGDEYEATVVGYDSTNDVALIKIDATGLTPVSIGDSDALQVGETVCAIGNPLGELTNTLTTGAVSALDREVNTDGTPINMLQTDCAINAGNSGGPLFDMNGNVIGITTAKYSGSTVESIGFAIPINDVMKIVADLQAYGYVTGKPFMGITVIDMDSQAAQMYNLPTGAFVYSVTEGSCAQTAGLQEQDIITAVGDYEVSTKTDLMAALKNFAAGDTTTLTVFRGGQTLTLTITFDEKQPEPPEDAQTSEDAQTEQGTGTPDTQTVPGADAPDTQMPIPSEQRPVYPGN